ncbi:MAG: hypothetical protein M1281_05885 [Chloroflexi bacterium]|nr:hypothetical protein [Chloroflexota bacterium]
MNTRRFLTVLIVATLTLALVPAAVFAKGGPPGGGEPTAVNNLSFPAIAVDGFVITPLPAPSFTVPYAGDYPGLTAEEIALLVTNGPWYAQKTTGNTWQAQFTTMVGEDVTYIDWGDNIESVYPKIRAPFRLEVTLYKQLATPMTSYTMAVLEYPSSSTELQGTNTTTYNNPYATVISAKPKLVIQFLGSSIPTLTWDSSAYLWKTETVTPTVIPVSFAPELNVGGKYIFGASVGGWKPTQVGYYRITFYIPTGSGVNLALAQIGNYATGFSGASEGTAATPVVNAANNLTYVDVLVKTSGGRR